MNRVSKLAKQLLMTLGALAAVGVLLSLSVPRAVHAAVAALVQVVNTPANPVPSDEVSLSAAQTVGIQCQMGANAICAQILPGGAVATTAYSVPSGQNLVITEIDVTTQVGSAPCFFGIVPVNTSTGRAISQDVVFPSDGLTHQFSFRNGIVWPPSSLIQQFGCNDLDTILRGYLTPI